jgi:hypothetical protein
MLSQLKTRLTRLWLTLQRDMIAMRLVSLGQLIESTREEQESARLMAWNQDRKYQVELEDLVLERDAFVDQLEKVRNALREVTA